MFSYTYLKPGADLARLQAECIAAGIPVEYINGDGDSVIIVTTRELTAPEQVALSNVVTAHDGRPRRLRSLNSILTDLQALSGAQQTAIWNDLISGTPAKWRATSSDQCVWAKATQASTNAIEKAVAVSFYVREHPTYLVNPTFSGGAGINVPGDEPDPMATPSSPFVIPPVDKDKDKTK